MPSEPPSDEAGAGAPPAPTSGVGSPFSPARAAGLPQGPLEDSQVLLRDGQSAHLRALGPADLPLLVDFLRRLAPETRAERFLAAVAPEVAAASLLRAPPGGERFGLIILVGEPDQPRIIAHGEYVRGSRLEDSAEVAFLVDESYQGRGPGTLLLERLVLLAAHRGIRRFWAETLRQNRAMLEVFRASGFEVSESSRGADVEVSFPLAGSPAFLARYELREKVATVASLAPLLAPRSVVLLGASREGRGLGDRLLRNLLSSGFRGEVHLVHPGARSLAGRPTYPSLEEVPGPVDLVVLSLPAPQVLSLVDACARKGARALVVVSAGFAESGPEGRERERSLVERVRGRGIRLLGPASLGVLDLSPAVRLNATLLPFPPSDGPLALASQSGVLAVGVLDRARQRDLGVRYFASLGNKADVSSNDLLQYWEDDPEVRVLLLYLESFGNPRRFARLARRIGRRKPLVALKSMRTASGARAASGHPRRGSLGETEVEALFRPSGVVRVETLDEALNVSELFIRSPPLPGPRILVLSNATGPGVVATDALEREGLRVPELSPEAQASFQRLLPGTGVTSNPVMLGIDADPERYARALRWAGALPEVDGVLVLWTPLDPQGVLDTGQALWHALEEARREFPHRPILWVSPFQPGPGSPTGGPFCAFPEGAARAWGLSWQYYRWRETSGAEIPALPPELRERLEGLEQAVLARGGGALDPSELSRLAEGIGLRSGPGPERAPEHPELRFRVPEAGALHPLLTVSLALPSVPREIAGPAWLLPLSAPEAEELPELLASTAWGRALGLGEAPERAALLQECAQALSHLAQELPSLLSLSARLDLGAAGPAELLSVRLGGRGGVPPAPLSAPGRTP